MPGTIHTDDLKDPASQAPAILGYRVRDVTKRSLARQYVHRGTGGAIGMGVYASFLPGERLTHAEALRICADWKESGYGGLVVRVIVKSR